MLTRRRYDSRFGIVRNRWLPIFSILVAIGLLGIIYYFTKNNMTVPSSISSQLNFQPIIPAEDNSMQLDKASFKYDEDEKVFSYTATIIDNNAKITVTEQTTPVEFVDIPEAYEKLQNSIQPYIRFDSKLGKVVVGKPTTTENEVAIINNNGVLMFITTDKKLDEETWRKVINNLSPDN